MLVPDSTDNPGCGDEVRADGLAALAGEEALDLSHFSKKLRAMHGKLPVVEELADTVRPIPTYGRFPLTAHSHLWPIPTYGPFPLTAHSHLRPGPSISLTARFGPQC